MVRNRLGHWPQTVGTFNAMPPLIDRLPRVILRSAYWTVMS
jgi:hypothetical protein